MNVRTWPMALLAFCLALLLAGGAWLTWSRVEKDAPLSYVPQATDKSLGVNADLGKLSSQELEDTLAAIESAGFRWLRQRFPWDAIEPERRSYDWTTWDAIVDAATRQDLEFVALLDGSPAWARAAEDVANPLAPPVESRDFGDWAAAFATRYGSRIDHYQIWDEPNIAPHWGAREIDPAAYARLLREGAIRIRAADPDAVILAAALAPNVEQGGTNMSELLFLDGLYGQGAAQWFDVMAGQPYTFDALPDEPADPARLNWNRLSLLRQVMASHGDVETAVWAVSFGLPAADFQSVGPVLEQSRGDWPWLGPMMWAAWSPDDARGEYALVTVDGRPGSAYEVLQDWALAPLVAWPGDYPASHPSGRYEGDWRVTPSGADIGRSGDGLEITFWGARLDLTIRRGDYRAFLYATVDGQPANALPRDVEDRAYVVLYDPLLQTGDVTLANGLPDGQHRAEIVAERGWGQWAIVGWAVRREAAGLPSWLPVSLGLSALLVLAFACYMAWPHRLLLFQTFARWVGWYRTLDARLILAITAAAAILLYLVVGTIPSLAMLGLLGLLLLLRPEMGLPLISLALPLYQLGKPLLGKVFSMVEILTLLTAAGWVVDRVLNYKHHVPSLRQRIVRYTAMDWGVVLLVAVGAFSLLWAEQGRVAAREFRTVVLEAGIFYGLLRALVRERSAVWRVADAWVLGGALIALVGIIQCALGQNLITAEGLWRVRGFYGSPNNLALYLGRVLPLGVAVAAFSTAPWKGRVGQSRRLAYGLGAAVISIALLLTYSRGAWLLGVPVSLLFLAAMRGRRTLVIVVGLLLVLAVAVLLVAGIGRLTSLLDTSEGTTFFRLQLWQSSWTMIRDHPVLGVGLDNFLYQYRTYYVLPTAWEEFDLSHPHNLVFDFWLRLGLPGLAVILWLLVAFFRKGWSAYRHLSEGHGRLLILGLMGGMVNFLAHGLVDNAFFLVDLAFAFMLMLALLQAADLSKGRSLPDVQ